MCLTVLFLLAVVQGISYQVLINKMGGPSRAQMRTIGFGTTKSQGGDAVEESRVQPFGFDIRLGRGWDVVAGFMSSLTGLSLPPNYPGTGENAIHSPILTGHHACNLKFMLMCVLHFRVLNKCPTVKSTVVE